MSVAAIVGPHCELRVAAALPVEPRRKPERVPPARRVAPVSTLPQAAAVPPPGATVATESAPGSRASGEVSKPIDPQIIRRAQSGDTAAFEQLYRLCSRRVYALCFRMVNNPLDAEELTQEAFLQVFRKIHTFRGDSAFTTWLHRLTFNAVLMRFRKKQPHTTSFDDFPDSDDEFGAAPRDIGAPDLRLAGTLDRMTLQRAIAQLPPGYKAIFTLHDVEGYGHDEISKILQCSIGNSKSQLHKARVKLRHLILSGRAKSRTKRKRRSVRSHLAAAARAAASASISAATRPIPA